MSPTIPAPHASPSVSSEARDDGSGTSESLQQAHYLKLFDVKKGSTEVMVQNLLKKNSSILQKNIVVRDEGTTFLIQYDTTEDAQKVAEEILGEKLNKKSFKVELITSDDAQVLLLPPQHSPPPVVLQESAALFDKDQSALLEALLATHLKNQNPKPKKKTKLSRKNVRFSPTKKSRKLKFKKSSKKVSRQSSQSEQSSSCQTISSDDREDDLQTKEMRSTIRSILQKDPVSRASASQPQQSISFDPKEGLPLPSEVFASKIASLLNNVNTGADQSKPNSGKLSKKKKSKGKKSRRRKSSSSSDSSSSTATSSSSSSSADSARNLRTYYEKLKKKGKLTSGRFRKGLPVVRGEEWPHEMINHALAGKSFSCDDLTAPAFIAGLLNQVIVSPEFEKIHKPKNLKVIQQKLNIINEMVHALVRTDNFKDISVFYYSTLEDIEKGKASWTDSSYWSHQILMFRTLLRPASSSHNSARGAQVPPGGGGGGGGGGADQEGHWYSTRNFCHEFNNTGCDQPVAHGPTSFRKFHLCKVCFRLEPTILTDDHGASSCPNKTGKSSQGKPTRVKPRKTQ